MVLFDVIREGDNSGLEPKKKTQEPQVRRFVAKKAARVALKFNYR